MAAFVRKRSSKGKFVNKTSFKRQVNAVKRNLVLTNVDHAYSKQPGVYTPCETDEYVVDELDIGIGIEVDDETNDSWKQGRRIVELEKLAQEMFCDMCNAWLHLKDTVREAQYGLGSLLFIRCTACGAIKQLQLGKRNDDGGFDINRKAVIAMYKAGMGPANLRAFLACSNLPLIDPKTISKIERQLGPVITAKAVESCDNARQEEMTRSGGSVACSFDAGWQTRGTGSQYNSNTEYNSNSKKGLCWNLTQQQREIKESEVKYQKHICHASLIGKSTGKVLDFDLRSKICRVCDYHGRHQTNIPVHDCTKNWNGSSKAMEADMAASMVRNLKELGTDVSAIHADNDSSTTARLKIEFKDIAKKDDQNHVKKGISKRLYQLSTTHKELKASGVIEYLVRCFMYAIKGNTSSSTDSLKLALARIVPHVFGEHTFCEEVDWCSFHENPEEFKYTSLPKGKPFSSTGLRKDLEEMVESYKKRASNLLDLGSTQANESFNNMVACKAPKNRFYGGSTSLMNRVSAATLEKNEGNTWSEEVNTAASLSPGYFNRKLGERLDRTKAYYRRKSKSIAFKRRRIALKKKRKIKQNKNFVKEGTQYSANLELEDHADTEIIPNQPDINGKDKIVFFDLETTSCMRSCDIVQLAATDGEHHFNRFVQPREPISTAASNVTGLTFSPKDNQLYKHGEKVNSTSIHKALLDFIEYLTSVGKPLLVGHNIMSFDTPILYNRLHEFGLCGMFMSVVKGCLDTLKIARRLYSKAEVGNHKQVTLVEKLLQKSYNAHDAQEDVLLLYELFSRKLSDYNSGDIYVFNYHTVLNSYKEMISKKVISSRSSQLLAQAGIAPHHLRLAHERDPRNGVKVILSENHVPLRSACSILDHFSTEE